MDNGNDTASRLATIVVAILLTLTAALIFIPNRWWTAASKKLSPPEKYRAPSKPDPWG